MRDFALKNLHLFKGILISYGGLQTSRFTADEGSVNPRADTHLHIRRDFYCGTRLGGDILFITSGFVRRLCAAFYFTANAVGEVILPDANAYVHMTIYIIGNTLCRLCLSGHILS